MRARLLNLARASGQSFDLVLTRFALERLLFRLSQSRYADRFVLKGAMLLMSWLAEPHRGTRDLDLLGFGAPSADAMLTTFREILAQDAGDGVVFDADALRVDRIREALEYGGLRLRTTASISGARINLMIDIGFGDALAPGAELIDYPVMLDLPAPRLRAYARETVIAEKFQAMVALGRANSRMKDFYDVWILGRSFTFDDDKLARAIVATFARRGTEVPPELPDALSPAFAADEQKQQQWRVFVQDVALDPGAGECAQRSCGFPHAARRSGRKVGQIAANRHIQRSVPWRQWSGTDLIQMRFILTHSSKRSVFQHPVIVKHQGLFTLFPPRLFVPKRRQSRRGSTAYVL